MSEKIAKRIQSICILYNLSHTTIDAYLPFYIPSASRCCGC